jgi:hypothetical protein
MGGSNVDQWALAFLIAAGVAFGVALLLKRRRAGTARAGSGGSSADASRLAREMAIAAEEGGEVHIALGTGGLSLDEAAASIAALRIGVRAAELAVRYGLSPTISVGDATLLPAAQDALMHVYERHGVPARYDPDAVTFVSPSALGYAAGAADMIASSNVSLVILSGSQSLEIGLTADPGVRSGSSQYAAVDSGLASAASFAATDWLSPGEGLFASAAEEASELSWAAALSAQDVLRYVVVAAMLGAALWALIGG